MADIVDTGPVLASAVISLTVYADRVNNFKKLSDQYAQCNNIRIIQNTDGFSKTSGVRADLLVRWIFPGSVGIAALRIADSRYTGKIFFHPPEASSSKIYFLHDPITSFSMFFLN